jgi:hypothetical protein
MRVSGCTAMASGSRVRRCWSLGPNRSVEATTRRQFVLIMMGTVRLRNGQLTRGGQRGVVGVSLAASRCTQRVAQSPGVVKRHEQRGGTSTALPNKRSQATAGGTCSLNPRWRTPAAPEAQRYTHRRT